MLGQFSFFAPDPHTHLRKRVSLAIITGSEAKYFLERFHYLHRGRRGRQIHYAVLIDGIVDGVITYAYPRRTVPLAGIPADEILEFARLFLYKNVPHSATCAIGQSLRRVAKDWVRQYKDAKTPRLVVSWSDATRHKGTIYRAANFEWHGRSLGSHIDGRGIDHPDYRHAKDCWVYRL